MNEENTIFSIKQLFETLESNVDLGHSKRNDSFLRQVGQYLNYTEGKNTYNWSESMSTYRFANNEKISLENIRNARMNNTLSGLDSSSTVLVMHDVSELCYQRHDSKTDRRSIGDGKGLGYEYVCNLGIEFETEQVVGVLHDSIVNAKGPDDNNVIDYHQFDKLSCFSENERERLEANHRHQMTLHYRYIRESYPTQKFIMVGDREFDDQFFLEDCISNNADFVVRSCAFRNIQIPKKYDWLPVVAVTKKYPGLPLSDKYVCADMKKVVNAVPLRPYKTIYFDGKGRLTDEVSSKTATDLSIGAFSARLYRNYKRNKQYMKADKYVDINIVVIKETNPPYDREPVLWVLFTSLPVSTFEQLCVIGRIYELRWMIECFFKYLKSGYKILEMRYNSAEKIAKQLVPVGIAATFAIQIKNIIKLPQGSILDDSSYKMVKHAYKNLNDSSISMQLRIFAYIATLGGWLGRRRDPISPLTLMKGIKKFNEILNATFAFSNFINEVAVDWNRRPKGTKIKCV